MAGLQDPRLTPTRQEPAVISAFPEPPKVPALGRPPREGSPRGGRLKPFLRALLRALAAWSA